MSAASNRCVNSLKYSLPRLLIVEIRLLSLTQLAFVQFVRRNVLLDNRSGLPFRLPNEFVLFLAQLDDKSEDTQFLTSTALPFDPVHMPDAAVFVVSNPISSDNARVHTDTDKSKRFAKNCCTASRVHK